MELIIFLLVLPLLDIGLWVWLHKLKYKEFMVSLTDGRKAWRRKHTGKYILTKIVALLAAIVAIVIVVAIAIPFAGGAATIPAIIALSLTRVAYRTVVRIAQEDAELEFEAKEKKKKK